MPLIMPWPPFTPNLILFCNLVQLMLSAVTAAGFPLFIFMWMYNALCTATPGTIYPCITSGTEPASCVWANNKISFVWANKWITSTSGGNKEISVK